MGDGGVGAGEVTSEVCIANIGARGERRRRRKGAIWLAFGIMGAAVLDAAHAGSLAQLVLGVPFVMATLGYFQAREHT